MASSCSRSQVIPKTPANRPVFARLISRSASRNCAEIPGVKTRNGQWERAGIRLTSAGSYPEGRGFESPPATTEAGSRRQGSAWKQSRSKSSRSASALTAGPLWPGAGHQSGINSTEVCAPCSAAPRHQRPGHNGGVAQAVLVATGLGRRGGLPPAASRRAALRGPGLLHISGVSAANSQSSAFGAASALTYGPTRRP